MHFVGVIAASLALLSCGGQAQIKYNLSEPEQHFTLPQELNEISGISYIGGNRLACVQDENGTVFTYDVSKGCQEAELTFDTDGDYEDIAFTGESLFILRSDGRLSEWKGFMPESVGENKTAKEDTILHHNLALLTTDNEGLCFDKAGNRLLIAAKSKPPLKEKKNERYIYAFDLLSRELERAPAYVLSMREIEAAAKTRGIVSKVRNASGRLKPLNFRPSGLAIDPLTRQVFIISAEDFLLLVMDSDGQIIHLEKLDETLFPKAEGISFMDDSRMAISNEGVEGRATLLVFTPVK
jgi:uncharacterized protein YjiK